MPIALEGRSAARQIFAIFQGLIVMEEENAMLNSTQLSLFATVETTYKIGDRVKLKRKTPAAACLKKGDIIQIAAIHPVTGSCKFWNELTESWGYVEQDEFILLPPEIDIDSVTPVEVAVTESTVLPEIDIDSVTPVEVAVTESTVLPEIDSVTPVEVAVTESTVLPDNDSVTPVEVAVTESTVLPDNDNFLPIDAVSTYQPRGTARGSPKYYRLSYKEGGKVRHIHIRGGNTDSPIAQAKVQEVRSLLASGMPPSQIATMLRN